MKLITTYKEHKEKPNEQVQGLGRALAYGGLDYIFNLLKNEEIYSEELEDGIIGIEAYVNEREKEIERLNNIIEEQYKELELERKSRKLLTDDLANVCKISLKKDNIIKEVREYIEYQLENLDFEEDTKAKMLGAMVLVLLDKEKE